MAQHCCAMTYQTFEDLPVWNEAIKLAELCEELLDAAGDAIRRYLRGEAAGYHGFTTR